MARPKSFLNIIDLKKQFNLVESNFHEKIFPPESTHYTWYPKGAMKRYYIECDDFHGDFDVNTKTGEVYWGEFIMSEYDGEVE
jgi:hypothetical protein